MLKRGYTVTRKDLVCIISKTIIKPEYSQNPFSVQTPNSKRFFLCLGLSVCFIFFFGDIFFFLVRYLFHHIQDVKLAMGSVYMEINIPSISGKKYL